MRKMKYVLLSSLLLTPALFISCKKSSIIMIVGVNETDWNEINVLVDALNNRNQETINNINFYTGTINRKNVVIAEAPIGTSEAAMTTTIGINHYNPKYVITEGTSGGHHAGVDYNDIILGKDVLNMASYQGDPFHPEGNPPESEPLHLLHPTLHSDEELLKKAREVVNPVGANIKEDGVIASSDCWNTGKEYVNALHTAFGEDCEEMESYAVLNVCQYFKVPSLAIRIISNNLITDKPYIKEAGENVQKYTINVIKSL